MLDVDVGFGPHDVLRPVLVGWRRERVPNFPRQRPIHDRPDWVCEILSPSTAARDRGPKRDVYFTAGVPWYWLIDLANRTISVLRWTAEGFVDQQTAGDEGLAYLAPFEAIALELTALFPPRIEWQLADAIKFDKNAPSALSANSAFSLSAVNVASIDA